MAPPNDDQLCWDWNPVGSGDLADTTTGIPPCHDGTPPSGNHHGNLGNQPAMDVTVIAPEPMPVTALAAFTLHHSVRPASLDPDVTVGGFHLGGLGPGDDLAAEAAPPGAVSGERELVFPEAGDGIAGFRLISELGRGAFGRVFLAEESLLGNRLVALKITQPLGDEPRLLARLQHTHIVPIHSVHDDPKTGLRVMCMPYFGGANLAQVLDAVASSRGETSGARSLLRALDNVAAPRPSEAMGLRVPRRRSSTNPSASAGSASSGRRGSSGAADGIPGNRSSLPSTIRGAGDSANLPADASSRSVGGTPSMARWSFLHRIPRWPQSIAVAQRAWPRSQPEPSGEQNAVQPARSFLRQANFIRASAWIIARLAEGLEHAHLHGLMHRDLKPSNILIAADGNPMLLDFNLAADSTLKAHEGDRVRMGGTLPYMAPEHLDAFHPQGTTPPEEVDERSDIYAMGLILFEMIAGHRPFREPDPQRPILETIQVMIKERRTGAPALRSINPTIPADLDAVVRKCLDPDPDRRHARAGDLAEDLRRFLDDLPLKYAAEPTIRGRLRKWVRRNPRATGAGTMGLLGLALITFVTGAAWSVSQHLRVASARLRFQAFEANFPRCQFYLNTVGGPAESLGQGITLAEDTLQQAGVTPRSPTSPGVGGWLDALPRDEQEETRRDLAEVILLLVRARVYLADHGPAGTTQRRTLEAAITWLDRAEEIDPRARPGPSLTTGPVTG